MEIVDVAIHSATRFNGESWFEGVATAFENNKSTRFSIDFPITEMKEMNVCNSLNGWKKIRAWANSEHGHAWILINRNRKDMMTQMREQGTQTKS